MSQQRMADYVGIPQKTWFNYESGRTKPKMDVLLLLAEKGHTIKGITSNLMEDWSEDQKKEYRRRMEILKTGAFPLEMPMDDFAKIVKAVDDNPPTNTDTSGLISELEKIIHQVLKRSKIVIEHESRLLALEEHLNIASDPNIEYPRETVEEDSYTADPEPEYETVPFREDIAAGPPIDQSEDESLAVDVPRRFIKTKPGDYYVLRIRGNSMIDALIPDGSMALIRKSDVPQDGKIQVVRVDERATLKRLREGEDHQWTLYYEDGTGRSIPMGAENLIQGDFITVLPPLSHPRMRGE